MAAAPRADCGIGPAGAGATGIATAAGVATATAMVSGAGAATANGMVSGAGAATTAGVSKEIVSAGDGTGVGSLTIGAGSSGSSATGSPESCMAVTRDIAQPVARTVTPKFARPSTA